MTTPKRVQMTRRHPWRADNPDAVIVARPSRWGNPYRVIRHTEPGCEGWAVVRDGWNLACFGDTHDTQAHHHAQQRAVDYFERDVLPRLDLTPLRGRDLACWCPLDQPCHADVLLSIANGGDGT